MRKRTFWVYDYETICNCFVAIFQDVFSDETRVFVVHPMRNDMAEFIRFLEENIEYNDWHFGYNSINFDGQITQHILENASSYKSMTFAGEITDKIYAYAQSVIQKSNNNEFLDYPEYKQTIRNFDIFRMNHWDSNAKRCSLKWVQYSMDWDNVEEMPFPHYEPVKGEESLHKVISYCLNDVQSTKNIFQLRDARGDLIMQPQINLRSQLSQKYDLNLYSASEPRISKEMFLHFLSEKLRVDKRIIRNRQTHRSEVRIQDVILPMVKFETAEFKAMHQWFKDQVVDTTIVEMADEGEKDKGPKYRMNYKGMPTDYGLGGLHGCTKPGIYVAEKGKKIVSADVTSFYPNLAIRNQWSPAHIPKKEFCELYEWFFEERKKYAKSDPLNYLFKIILNATYGLSKSKYSFLYDPEFTYRITVNGQLLLSMLYEMVATRIPGAVPLMQNTDGLEFMIDEEHEELFFKICKEWEEMTNLQLETVEYSKMIIADVNNYIAVYTNPAKAPKCKGRFEYEDLPLHKNKSFLIIPKALYAYFVHGTNPKDFLESNRNIFDYCAGAKLRGNWFFLEHSIVDGEFKEKQLQKLVRYFISKKGVKVMKCNPDGRAQQIESGKWMQTIMNRYHKLPFEQYGVNDDYYLDSILREIGKVEVMSSIAPPSKEHQYSLF